MVPTLVLVVLGCGTADSSAPRKELPEARAREEAVVGGAQAEGAKALGRVVSVALLPAQSAFAVADGQTRQINVFSYAGLPIRSAGRNGDGPGEFGVLSRIWRLPDGNLLAWDQQLARITAFGPELELLRTLTVNFGGQAFVGFFNDWTLVVRGDLQRMALLGDTPEGERRDTVLFVLRHSDGQGDETIVAKQDETKLLWHREVMGLPMYNEQDLIFGRRVVGVILNDELLVASTDSAVFVRHGRDGSVKGEFAVDLRRRPVTPSDVDAERERLIRNVETGPSPVMGMGPEFPEHLAEARRGIIHEVRSYATLPAFEAAIPTTDGTLWLRESSLPQDASSRWVLMSATGELLEALTLPSTTAIVAAGDDRVITLERDEFDADVLRVLRIER